MCAELEHLNQNRVCSLNQEHLLKKSLLSEKLTVFILLAPSWPLLWHVTASRQCGTDTT